MKISSSQQSGFSLVETLVAITILLLVIAGPMAISSSAARSTSFSSEQVVAFFLAQEGAELVQKARDDILIKYFIDPADTLYSFHISNPWGYFTDTSGSGPYEDCFASSGCGLEINTNIDGSLKAPVVCNTSTGSCDLYYDNSAERSQYTHINSATASTTPFSRVITITPDTLLPNDSVKVTSKVTWRTGAQRKQQEVSVETYLFNVYTN